MQEEERARCINLAMQIDTGVVPENAIIDMFTQYPLICNRVISFWMNFDDMTRGVVKRLVIYKYTTLFEKCLDIEAQNYPEIEQ